MRTPGSFLASGITDPSHSTVGLNKVMMEVFNDGVMMVSGMVGTGEGEMA